jgi:hypothetical protein
MFHRTPKGKGGPPSKRQGRIRRASPVEYDSDNGVFIQMESKINRTGNPNEGTVRKPGKLMSDHQDTKVSLTKIARFSWCLCVLVAITFFADIDSKKIDGPIGD